MTDGGMNSEKLVSVIMPTRNRSEMLARAIDSVLNQSYKNWEIIIVADHCTDNTAERINRYLADERIKFIELTSNVGAAQARNIGLDMASGYYIAFLDDDDIWMPMKLEKQIECFERINDIAVVSCNYRRISAKGIRKVKFSEEASLSELLYENILGSFSFCMTLKKYIGELRINTALHACQDWDLWLKILVSTGSRGHVIKYPLVQYDESHHSGRLSVSQNVFPSYVKFVNSKWRLMSRDHKLFHLANMTRQRHMKHGSFSFRMYFKAIKLLLLGSKRSKLRKYYSFCVLPLLLHWRSE